MYRLFFFSILVGFLSSCEDSRGVSPTPSPYSYVRINTFTKDKMTDQYFWAEEVKDKDIDPDSNPAEYFAIMKYPEDRWSRIMNTKGLGEIADASGYDAGFGYNLTFWEKDGYIFADVNFVYPNSPAEKAGLKRGDLITHMNGERMTTENYTNLYYATQLSIGLSNDEVSEPYETKELTAQTYIIDPVLDYGLIPLENQKIGYMVYTDFVYRGASSLLQLNEVFQTLKSENIEEFILDLRYNQGGYIYAVKQLCSLLAPENVVENEELLIHKIWNRAYQEIYANDPSRLEERFDNTVPVDSRLNLKRLWVITSKVTASAAEMLISALSPYMEVNIVGDTTMGKNMGGIIYTPDDKDLQDWNIMLISTEYRNSRGESVKDGITPMFFIQEQFHHQHQLGDKEEPLLAATLQFITQDATPTPAIGSRSSNRSHEINQFRRIIPEFVQAKSRLLLGIEQ